MSKTDLVNVINTFKCSYGGSNTSIKAIRWTQAKFQEVAAAINNWASNALFPSMPSRLRRVNQVVDSVVKNGLVKSPFRKFGLDLGKVWNPKLKSVLLQVKALVMCVGFRIPPLSIVQAISLRCSMYSSRLACEALDQETQAQAQANTEWKEWVKVASAGGASAAHKFTKAPLNARIGEGEHRCRADIMEGEASHYAKLWDESPHPPTLPAFQGVAKLPLLSAAALRRTSASFNSHTCAMGGVHPRHFALLPDAALDALAQLFVASEAIGVLPQQAMQVFICLIPKPISGTRPIGLYQSTFRLWGKARKSIVADWESSICDNGIFAAGKHKSSLDVAWRVAMKKELASSSNLSYAAVFWDLYKCYELIKHDVLFAAAVRHKFPLAILRITIASYQQPRRLIMHDIVSRCIQPSRGIIAGVMSATAELKCVLLDAANALSRNHPHVSLHIYIDDLKIDCTADNTFDLLRHIVPAAEDLALSLEQDLVLPISKDKAAVVSNSFAVARTLRRALGDLGGPHLGSIRALGVDVWSGHKAPRGAYKVRKTRHANLGKRRHRLHCLKKASVSASGKIFVSGILPSILYDAPVYGIFGKRLAKVRREAACMLGLTNGKAINLAFSFQRDKDPEISSNAAVVKRFCKEVFVSSLPTCFRDPAVIPLASLGVGIKEYLRLHKVPPSAPCGPLSACHKAFHAAGWSFVTPFVVKTRNGRSLHLLSVSPRRVVASYKDDMHEVITHRGTAKMYMKLDTDESKKLFEQGILFDPLRTLYNRLPPSSANTLLKIVCGTYTTDADLYKFGYDVDPACSLCGSATDSVFHRCYSCPFIETRARNNLGTTLFNKIIEEGDTSLRSSRCLHPAPIILSKPSEHTIVNYINFSANDSFNSADGEIYGDVSCLHPSSRLFARAGFAAVQLRPNGEVLRAIFGCIPASLPQTSLAGEFGALSAGYDACSGGNVFVSDCSEVVRSHAIGFHKAINEDTPHCCTWRILHQRYNRCSDGISSVVKTKAHRALAEVENDAIELLRFKGNEAADLLAKQGAVLHAPDPEDLARYKDAKTELIAIANHMVETLSDNVFLRRERFQRVPVLPKGFSLASGNSRSLHNFVWQGQFWICSSCLLKTFCLSSAHAKGVCSGETCLADVLTNSQGHSLYCCMVVGGGFVLYCDKCWSYCCPHPRNLKRKCPGVPYAFGRAVKHYISNSRHPVSRSTMLCPPFKV